MHNINWNVYPDGVRVVIEVFGKTADEALETIAGIGEAADETLDITDAIEADYSDACDIGGTLLESDNTCSVCGGPCEDEEDGEDDDLVEGGYYFLDYYDEVFIAVYENGNFFGAGLEEPLDPEGITGIGERVL